MDGVGAERPTRPWIRSTRSVPCRVRALLASLRSSSTVRASWGSSPRRSITCTVISRTDSGAGAGRSTSSTSRASSPGLNQLLGRRTALGRIVAGSNSGANSRRTSSTCSKSARCWPIRFSRRWCPTSRPTCRTIGCGPVGKPWFSSGRQGLWTTFTKSRVTGKKWHVPGGHCAAAPPKTWTGE